MAKTVYDLTEDFPAREIYGLGNQLRRSAVSVAANIAEGQARNSHKEFKYFLGISLGSLAELETLLIIAVETQYVSEDSQKELFPKTDEIARMLKGLIKHISRL